MTTKADVPLYAALRPDGRGVRAHPQDDLTRPSHTELAMFSVMWSEQPFGRRACTCADLPTEAPWVARPGEGAGVVADRTWRAHRFQDGVAQTTRPQSSPTRVRRPASVGSSGTSSRSAPVRSRCSTRCVSALDRRAQPLPLRRGSSGASRRTATRSDFRPSAAKWFSTRRTRVTRS